MALQVRIDNRVGICAIREWRNQPLSLHPRRMTIPKTISDIHLAIERLPITADLALQDLSERYQRSVFGPIWIAMNLLAVVAALGMLYAFIFKQPLDEYVPFLATSLFVWQLFQNTITESAITFQSNAGIIKNTYQPLLSNIFRVIVRNLLVAAHALPIVIGALVVFGKFQNIELVALIAGALLLVANLSWLCIIVAMLGARFRDVPYMLTYALQFLMFLSPIFWQPQMLRGREELGIWNPFWHWLAVVREPLLGQPLHLSSFAFCALSAAVGWVVAVLSYHKFRSRVPFWI